MLTGEIRRRVLHPFWVQDPLLWENPTTGIANFARDGKVGLFNLSWWMLGQSKPNNVNYSNNPKVVWCILSATKVRMRGKSILDIAAMLTEKQFNQIAREMTNAGPMTPYFVARSSLELGRERTT